VSPSALEQRQRAGRAGAPPGFFTSGLSVDEFVLTKAAGFDPVGIVMGTSVYPILAALTGPEETTESIRSLTSGELKSPTSTLDRARTLALQRLVAEARALNADGVVGVRLETAKRPGSVHLLEFVALGTAVVAPTGKAMRPSARTAFTSDLSGQDLYALLSAGYRPLSLVMGCSIYRAYQSGAHFLIATALGGTSQNSELEDFTEAVNHARRLATHRLRDAAQAVLADGVVGVQVKVETHLSRPDAEFRREVQHRGKKPAWIWRSLTIEVFVYGTAIASLDVEQPIAAPGLVVLLDT
jgi:uncharacterized protein YbjQ (UPF0145 family)